MHGPKPNPDAQLVRGLALADPDFAAFAACHGATPAIATLGEARLAQELRAWLERSPDQSERMKALPQAPPRFDGGGLSVPLLLAAVFLYCAPISVPNYHLC